MALVVGGVAVDLTANAAQIIGEMNRAAAAVQKAAGQMQGNTNKLASSFNQAEQRVNASIGKIGNAFRSLQGTLAVLGVGLGAREIIRYADSYKLVEAQLRLVTGSAEEAAAVQERLFQSAQSLGVGVDALNTIFIRTARNAESLGVSQETIIQASEALGAAIKISGTSASEAQNALIQLSQSFASGVLRGDELRSVAEQLPVVLDAVAAATGRTRQEIINFARENGLAADIVIQALVRQRDAFVEQADAIGGTVEQAMNRVQNAIQRVAGQAGEAGAFQPLTDSLNSFAASLESPRVGAALSGFAAAVVTVADMILKEFGEVATVGSALMEGRFGDALDAVIARYKRLLGLNTDLKASFEDLKSTGLFPQAPGGEVFGPPLPPLKLEKPDSEKPVIPGGTRIPTTGGAVFGPPAPPVRFDPSKFHVSAPPILGPPDPGAGFLAEEQAGLAMVAANEQLIAQYEQINTAAATFAQEVSKGFTDAITGAKTFDEALRGIAEALVQAVIQAVILQGVTSAIGAAGGGGLLGSLFPAPRAAGGPVSASNPYLVGERGPELFVPSRAGQIVPNNQLGGGGGGSVINIDARQSPPGTAAAAVAAAVRLAPGAVVNAQARGMAGRQRAPF